jgi:subtilase family serine protease
VKTLFRLTIFLSLLFFICLEAASAGEITERLDYPEYWLQEGVAQYSLHNYDRALMLIDNALGQDPTLASAWMWRGKVLEKLGRTEEAGESNARARELDPLIEDPFRKKVGALAELEVTPVPTARPVKEEDEIADMIASDVDIGKKPDPTGPDLTMYDLQASLSSETKQVLITAVIGNEGIKPSRDFFITFFGSYNTPVTSNDSAIGFYLVPNLLPGTKKTIQGYFPVSRIPSGNYYIGAYMDPNNEVMEISEENNGKTAPTLVDVPEVSSTEGSQLGGSQLAVPKTPITEPVSNKRADLVVEQVSGPTEVYLGDTVPVTTTVRNAGDEDAGQFRMTVYLSRDSMVTDDDISLGSGDVSDLAAGKAREGSASVTIPLNVIPGSYYLIALADSQNKILERNKDNNSKVQQEQVIVKTLELNGTLPSLESTEEETNPAPDITPVPSPVVPSVPVLLLPDLVARNITSATTGKPGGNIDVSTTVINEGEGDSGKFTVSLFLSPDTIIRKDEDLLVGIGEIETLFAGKQRSGNATAPVPATIKPGTYYFGLFVDSDRVINETDETNNYGSSLVPIIIE